MCESTSVTLQLRLAVIAVWPGRLAVTPSMRTSELAPHEKGAEPFHESADGKIPAPPVAPSTARFTRWNTRAPMPRPSTRTSAEMQPARPTPPAAAPPATAAPLETDRCISGVQVTGGCQSAGSCVKSVTDFFTLLERPQYRQSTKVLVPSTCRGAPQF